MYNLQIIYTMKQIVIDGIRYELNKEDKTATVIPLDSGAYSGDVVIPNTIFEKKFFGKDKVYHVVYIGNYAFKNANLLSITMPCTIRNIADNAFVGCDSLKCIRLTAASVEEFCNHNKCNYKLSEILDDIERRIVINGVEINDIAIPKGITNIKKGTFCSCALYSISIPNTVKEIEEEAFYNCASLTSINIPDSVLKIGSYAFSECSSIVSIKIPKCIRIIEDRLFAGCNSLEFVIIPNSVSKIGESAFFDCSVLKSIVIPDSVSTIGEFAFSNCSSLSEVNIPNGVETIYDCAFSECHSLTKVVIPHSIKSMGKNVFSSCSALTTIHWDTNYTFDSDEYNVFLEIAPQITSMVFGDNIENISSSICKGMNNLANISLGKNVISIELNAFADTVIYRTNDILYIDNCLIRAKVSGDYVIRDGTYFIADFAFLECGKKLRNITIPNCVKNIGKYAFGYCGLESITIPDSVTSIGEGAFSGCSSLTSITIPDSVTSVGNRAFSCCYSLTSIIIPNSVTSIGDNAFIGCKSLTSITIPNSVTSIGDSAFEGCKSLSSIAIPDSVTSIGYAAFDGCSSLTSIILPDKLTQIENSAFSNCVSLAYIFIPTNVQSIGRSTFSGCLFAKNGFINNSSCDSNDNFGATIYEEEFDGLLINNHEIQACRPFVSSITIPSFITKVKENIFVNLPNLTAILWDVVSCEKVFWKEEKGEHSWDRKTEYFYGPFAKIASQITSFEFGPNVRDIPEYLCRGMYKLHKITIPSNVRTIAKELGGSFKEITIPIHLYRKYYNSSVHNSSDYHYANDLHAIFNYVEKINIKTSEIDQFLV